MAHLQSSVESYSKIVHGLNMKKGRSDTLLTRARKVLILELNDSAPALVERSMK